MFDVFTVPGCCIGGGGGGQRLKHCFPTYDVAGKKAFRTEAMAIIQDMCDKQLVTKECAVRAGSVLNVPEGHRCVSAVPCVWF